MSEGKQLCFSLHDIGNVTRKPLAHLTLASEPNGKNKQQDIKGQSIVHVCSLWIEIENEERVT